ncbi:MAG: hypothetical protein ABIW84_09420 [Ilumatobacteraceae bacterium]
MTEPIRVLCVCTHNRTRSVMTGGLLQRHLTRLRVDALVITAGTMPGGQPPMERAVRLLAGRGIVVDDHRSQALTDDLVSDADLIVTAERDHVVAIAGRWPKAFGATFTLPEIVALAERAGSRLGGPVDAWLARVGSSRVTALDYLDSDDLGELADPTGKAPAVWDKAFAEIDDLTRRLATVLV